MTGRKDFTFDVRYMPWSYYSTCSCKGNARQSIALITCWLILYKSSQAQPHTTPNALYSYHQSWISYAHSQTTRLRLPIFISNSSSTRPHLSSSSGRFGSGLEVIGETFLLGPPFSFVSLGVSLKLLDVAADEFFAAVGALDREVLAVF